MYFMAFLSVMFSCKHAGFFWTKRGNSGWSDVIILGEFQELCGKGNAEWEYTSKDFDCGTVAVCTLADRFLNQSKYDAHAKGWSLGMELTRIGELDRRGFWKVFYGKVRSELFWEVSGRDFWIPVISRMTMGTRTAFPAGESLSAFSALNLIRNYNQFLGPPGSNLVQVYHHYTCGSSPLGNSPAEDSRSFSLQPQIRSFHPYLPYPIPTSPPLSEIKSSPVYLSPSTVYGRRPRGEKKPIPDDQKDDRYYERRKRNNQAAKKSRDARKLREDQIALRAALLEHENAILRAQLLTLREETQSLRQLILNQKKVSGKPIALFPEKGCGMKEEEGCLKKWDPSLPLKNLNNHME